MKKENTIVTKYYQISILIILIILIGFGVITLVKKNISNADRTYQDVHLPDVIY